MHIEELEWSLALGASSVFFIWSPPKDASHTAEEKWEETTKTESDQQKNKLTEIVSKDATCSVHTDM